MAFKIYTKTGDLGKTSLIGGTKVPKSHLRIESYGTVDELNSFIGLVSDHLTHEHTKIILKEIQDRLFTVGSSLACDPDKEPLMKIPDLKEADIVLLENEIDAMNEVLAPMKSFIIPCGPLCLPPCRTYLCKHAGAGFICRTAGYKIYQPLKRLSFCIGKIYWSFTGCGGIALETESLMDNCFLIINN
jgi:cob(I)alamin adenosyltransferase